MLNKNKLSGEREELSKSAVCLRWDECGISQLVMTPTPELIWFSSFLVSFQYSLPLFCCTYVDYFARTLWLNPTLCSAKFSHHRFFSKYSMASQIKPTPSKIMKHTGFCFCIVFVFCFSLLPFFIGFSFPFLLLSHPKVPSTQAPCCPEVFMQQPVQFHHCLCFPKWPALVTFHHSHFLG